MSATTQSPAKFSGWGAFDKDSVKGQLRLFDFEPKPWDDDDIEFKIQYCGVCASDLHIMRSGWGAADYPQVVGHEIVGIVTRVGSEVKDIKVGDTVGVGAQCDSCQECGQCTSHHENYCEKGVTTTYGGIYTRNNGKGEKTYGGYANYHRSPARFVFKIPDGLDPAFAAPMLCGGVTSFAPLVKYGAGKTAKNVGVIGIGGLGHFGLLFAKALGARVTAISHSESKRADAEKLGADAFIATKGGKEAFAPHQGTLDLIICTSNQTDMPINDYISLVRTGGTFVFLGAPEGQIPSIDIFPLLFKNVHVTGSLVGPPSVIRDMLELASKQTIKPWIIKRPMSEVNQVVVDMDNGKARYRYVLVNEDQGGKL